MDDFFLATLSYGGGRAPLPSAVITLSLVQDHTKPVCQGVDSCLWDSEGCCDILVLPHKISSQFA